MLSKRNHPSHSHFMPAKIPSKSFDKGALLAYSPVAAMLDRFKTAEAAWNQEKAQYRHEAEAQKKKANKLQLEYEKLQTAYRHQSSELKAVTTALKSRDGQLVTAERQLKGLQEADANDKQSLADIIANLRGERHELSDLLDAATQRMSHLEAANVQHGNKEASLKDKVLVLENERTKAANAARDAQSETADLQQTCDRLGLQNRLLQKLLDVQQKHNRSKVESIQRFLDTGADQLSNLTVSSSNSSDESDSDEANSAGQRMEDLLRAFHVVEQQRNMPPSLLPDGGLQRHRSKRRSPGHKRSHK